MLKKNKFLIVFIVISLMLTAFGCGTTGRRIGRPQTLTPSGTAPSQATTPSGTTTTPPGTVVTIKPPGQLTVIDNMALKIISDVNTKKWKNAEKKVATLKSSFTKLTPSLTSAGVPSTTINNIITSLGNLTTNITNKKTTEAKIDANDVTRYIADVMGSYKNVVPTDFLKLEYYLRDMEYNLPTKNWTKVGDDLNFVKSIWESSRVLINTKSKNIKKMDALIKSLESGASKQSTKMILRDVKKGKTIISSIEKEFSKKKK